MTCKFLYFNFLVRTLDLIRPFVPFLPEIQSPGRQIPFQEKVVWTTVTLLIYLVSSQVPLFGIITANVKDPLGWMRMMMASNRGTLMDLGISPVITSGMILQMLTSSELIKVNFQLKEDKLLYQALTKFLAVLLTVGQAIVQVISGFYGSPNNLGLSVSVLLVVQLLFSGIIVIMLDELLQKGYGFGSGINLFIATNVCENIVWKAFSPRVYKTARGIEFEGSIISLIYLLVTKKNKIAALYEAFFRQNLPNCACFVSTIFIFCIVIYLQGLRVELPTESTQVRGQVGRYPIKLLYASTMPIIVQNYMVTYTSTASRLLYNKFPHFFLVRLLGVWEHIKGGNIVPVSGICYFLYPPQNLTEFITKPIHSIIYVSFILLFGAFFSRAWIDITENNQNSVAEQMKSQKITLRGVKQDNIAHHLEKYVPTAAFLSGFFVGLVVLLSDLLDTIGSGTNIILAVSIVWQYLELFVKESLTMKGMAFID
ncbi:SEC61 alpha subunit [Spraguea lophii 42_110]|uniref:SEC61 alpha subunit n=1 Tax=Spraguea lophii (strain 42_110) TaxID=1358809 RepID=S7WBX6_SPRLO|nr:SEC61 alpha subunit [Spraguea lophii 42_110]